MKMHSIIVIAGMAILALGSCVSTVDDYYEKTSLDVLEQDKLYSDSPCDLCSNHSTCELYKITVLTENGSSLQMCVDILSANKCCNVIASNCASYPLDVRVAYCLNVLQDDLPYVVEITNYVFINSLLGVDNISEGYNLSLQVRGKPEDKYRYQMLLEPEYDSSYLHGRFSLAFVQPITNDKYYILPKDGEDDVVLLTIHKNVTSAEKFVFTADKIIIP